MISKEGVQSILNTSRYHWGKTSEMDGRDLWKTPANLITSSDVIDSGIRHCCPVIYTVITNTENPRTPVEIWRAYNGKNKAFENISELLINTNPELSKEWQKRELRKNSEKTHPEVKKNFQYPEGFRRYTLFPNARMPQYYLSDHFRTLDHIVNGALPKFADNLIDQQKYLVIPEDYLLCAKNAINLDNFTALVAVQTAHILRSRGVSIHKVAELLAQNFAGTGSIREYGQQKHAQKIVDLILKEIKKSGDLPGLSKQFRELARPKVQVSYLGIRNHKLNPNSPRKK